MLFIGHKDEVSHYECINHVRLHCVYVHDENPNFEQHCSFVLNKYTSANPAAFIHSGLPPSLLQIDAPKSGYHIPN